MQEIDQLPTAPANIIENPMEKFFNQIVTLTNHSMNDIMLKKASDLIYNTIMNGFQKNIQLAAMRGYTHAYLCIYEINAKCKDYIPIDSFIHMNEHMTERFKESHIESVMDRIRKKLMPFIVNVDTVEHEIQSYPNDGLESPDTGGGMEPESDHDHDGGVTSEKITIVIISVQWPKAVNKPVT
jgi:hypothetical protein